MTCATHVDTDVCHVQVQPSAILANRDTIGMKLAFVMIAYLTARLALIRFSAQAAI